MSPRVRNEALGPCRAMPSHTLTRTLACLSPTPYCSHADRDTQDPQGLASLATPPTQTTMPTYRFLDPPERRNCFQCCQTKATITEFDWVNGWPAARCKDCRRENHRNSYATKAAQQTHRDHLNAQRRARYARAKRKATSLAAYEALPEAERVRLDGIALEAQEAREVAKSIREAKLTYGRWREREIRAGRMTRPPPINPYTGKPRPTKAEAREKRAIREEDAPRPKPPRWADLLAGSERLTVERRARRSAAQFARFNASRRGLA